MAIDNIDNATTTTNDQSQQDQISSNEPKEIKLGMDAIDLDIENQFQIGELLGKLNISETDNSKEQDKLKEELPSQEEKAKEDTDNDELQIEALLDQDPNFKKVEDLKKLGYTEEQALESVFGDQKKTQDENIIENEFSLPQLTEAQIQAYNTQYKSLNQDQINYMVEAVQKPTEAHLISFIKSYPEKLGITKEVAEKLNELPVYENDPIATGAIRSNIQAVMQSFYKGHLDNIQAICDYQSAYSKVEETFITKAHQKLLSEFPAVCNHAKDPNMAAKHEAVYQCWANMFNSKLQNLSPKLQNDPKANWKVFEQSIEDFKKVYPVVLKRLKMQPQQQTIPDSVKQKEMKSMESFTTSIGKTNIDNAKTYTIKDWDNNSEIGNVLGKLLE